MWLNAGLGKTDFSLNVRYDDTSVQEACSAEYLPTTCRALDMGGAILAKAGCQVAGSAKLYAVFWVPRTSSNHERYPEAVKAAVEGCFEEAAAPPEAKFKAPKLQRHWLFPRRRSKPTEAAPPSFSKSILDCTLSNIVPATPRATLVVQSRTLGQSSGGLLHMLSSETFKPWHGWREGYSLPMVEIAVLSSLYIDPESESSEASMG